MSTVFLLRHGETTGDVEDRYGGDYDDHLTERGIQQAHYQAQKLKDRGIEVLYTSPLIRTRETGEILQPVLDCRVEVVPELKERNNYGVMTGLTRTEAKERYPAQVELLAGFENTVEGAEPYPDFAARISTVFNLLSSTEYGCVALLTHGGPIRFIFRTILKRGNFRNLGDCAIIELERTDEAWRVINIHNAELEQA